MRLEEGAYKVSNNLIKKITDLKATPLLFTPEMINDLPNLLKICSGFIIPGGNNWHIIDEMMINYALINDIPLLGICAGMQAIANRQNFCGSDESDKTIPIKEENHYSLKKYCHHVNINNGLLKNIIQKDRIKVNSRHHFKVIKEDFFQVDAWSDDKIIEAIHIPNKKFILGIQWHPEDLDDENTKKIFETFITATKNKI